MRRQHSDEKKRETGNEKLEIKSSHVLMDVKLSNEKARCLDKSAIPINVQTIQTISMTKRQLLGTLGVFLKRLLHLYRIMDEGTEIRR